MSQLTIAVCSYNRSANLPGLIRAIRAQQAPVAFDILVVDNNSSDDTQAVLESLAAEEGAPLRYVLESNQGITHARNRAIEECLSRDYMAFLDDDELPADGWLAAACDALMNEGAECVGGEIVLALEETQRPRWLVKELCGFLGALEYGADPFWIENNATPVWSGNIAYNVAMFRDDPTLRFDLRFNREGNGIGGGEDMMMFLHLLGQGRRIRYRPDMRISHFVDDFKLVRSYFLKLHYLAGRRAGLHKDEAYSKTILGVPPFLLLHLLRDMVRTIMLALTAKPALRQAMNAANTAGLISGLYHKRAQRS